MKRISNVITAIFLVAAAAVGWAQDNHDLLRRSDALAQQERAELRVIYETANAAFAKGDYAAAFRDYDYAAWQGSLAAASRLCVLDAYGIGTAPNPLKAAFWCERAAQAGQEMTQVQRYLSEFTLVGQ